MVLMLVLDSAVRLAGIQPEAAMFAGREYCLCCNATSSCLVWFTSNNTEKGKKIFMAKTGVKSACCVMVYCYLQQRFYLGGF